MNNVTRALEKMFEAIEICNAVLKTGDTKAINAAYDVQFDAIKAYDEALKTAKAERLSK
jgi:division protein CdvB (Snf7/Vps24/ESCRT-III family)